MTLSWMCFCSFIWMAATSLHSIQAKTDIRYPKIKGTETITCDCPDHTCQEVFWYRFLQNTQTLQFLLFVNSAGREQLGDKVNQSRFKGTVTQGFKNSYFLRVSDLQEDDAGLYSCLFKNKHEMPEGAYIKPGENPPTVKPPTVRTERPRNPHCCESSVLWPGVGALLFLAVIIAGTLFYFSREL
ncbi:hypothetical protein DNTS_003849 [Danionella cerebrum]|uniref:Immunoglobulin V-set domain-containing protein n=1 Tax=Danionella cerebrum TaxID=2873325 RepID=A0A553QYW0_9TELE|nr:hypothetical protein DNTS_003849 [Danionella translucida]